MSDSQINKTTAAQVASGDWPVLRLNEVDIERKCGSRMGYEPDVSHSEVYLPRGKIDEVLVSVLESIPYDEEEEWHIGDRIAGALLAYEALCDDGTEEGPWLVRRGREGPFYHAEGTEGLRWTASTEAAAKFEQKGRAEGLVSDLHALRDEGLGFRPGELIVVALAAAR